MKILKYFLFTMFFIPAGWACKAQGYYELYIRYNLHNSTSNDCECKSRVRITVHIKDKTTNIVSQEIVKDKLLRTEAYRSDTEELRYVFSTSKEIVKIEFYTRRDYRKGLRNKCTHASDGTWTVSNITYPEFTARATSGNIHGYGDSWGGSTWALIRLAPLTNKKQLTLKMNLRESQAFKFDHYEAKIIEPYNKTTTLFSPRHNLSVSTNAVEEQTAYYVKDMRDDISKISIDLRKSSPQHDDLSFTGKIPPPEDGSSVVIKSSIKNNLGDPIFTAEYRTVHAPLKVPQGAELTDVGNMTLEATGGFPENSISWAYYVGEPTTYPSWIKFPDHLQKKNKITFTAQDIGITDAQTGKKVNFVYTVGTGWKQESEIQTFTLMKKAPEITEHQTTNPTCIYNKDGSITLWFDRELTENERLEFVIANADEPDYTGHNTTVSELAEDRSYTFKGLSQGKYSISYIAKKNGVEESTFGPEYRCDDLEIVSPKNIEVQYKEFDVNCFGGHDGRIAIDVSGGTGPYQIKYSEKWTPGSDMTIPEFTGPDTINGLKPSTYIFRISDSNKCHSVNAAGAEIIAERMIKEFMNDTVILNIDKITPPLGFGLTNGTISVYADRGTPGYSFFWKKNGLDFDAHTEDSYPFSIANQTVGDGLYHIRVQDSRYAAAMRLNSKECNIRGCYDTISIRIIEPPKLEVVLAVKDSILCNGDANGSIVARARGGVPYGDTDAPYRYEWQEDQLYVNDTVLNELSAGTYRVTVTDGNGITESVTYTLTQPDVLQASATGNTILCDGDTDGRMEASVIGGTRPYRYRWSSAHAQLDGDARTAENLTGGKYAVEVTDYHRCVTAATGEVSVPRGMQTPDTVSVPPVCHDASDGKIILPVTGGAAGYRYLWNTGAVTPNLSGIPAGRYSVRITDANNCFIERRFSLSNPAPLSVDIGPDLTLCKGQSAVLSAAVPDPGAYYKWYNRYGLFREEPEAEVSSGGEYRVAVTDRNGCTGGDTVTVVVSNMEIAADFVAAAKAACTIPACFVNISHPAPDRTEWLVPDDPSILVMGRDERQLELRFNSEGTYRIGLRSGVGNCEKTAYRDITVVGKYDLTEYEPQQEAFLRQFKLWPNPNDGRFTVSVELSEPADIQLRLITSAGIVGEVRRLTGSDRYEELFSTDGNPGVYILQLVSKKAVAAIQIVIN